MKKFAFITLFLAVAFRCAAVLPGDDFNAATTSGITALQEWYTTSGVWTTTGWWNAANCIDAVEYGIDANNGQNQTYFNVLSNTFEHNSATNFLNGYYDDEGWWTEAWIKAYDLTGNVDYLNMAEAIFADITGGWDTNCGGGVWWDKTHTYKNAIPNELFLVCAARLHQRTPGDSGVGSYFYWATNEWTWFSKSGMINGENLVNDGLTDCQNNGETTWTYNQGVILGGLAELYKITNNPAYLTQAEKIATAAIGTLVTSQGILQEPCETDEDCGSDGAQFKGIFMRNLAVLYDVDHKSAYYNFLYTNAHSVWANDRNSSNQLGLKWSGPLDSADAARQSSAISPISAITEPSTGLLVFAKGSGDPGFNHIVGQAAGTLAWACNPSIASGTGFMQEGPFLTSLTTGAHVVHYRIAVSALSSVTSNLIELLVLSQGSTVVTSNVSWNSFGQANQAQDFALPFVNSMATNSLEFRVLWNQVTTAPTVTLSDITVDGSHNWTAANLIHNIGRLDGLNAWEADPARDTASGYLATGPGTSELPPGAYSAQFELKVDNFNWDNSTIATLSIVDTDSNTTIASRSVTRGQFPDTLYHPFALNFEAAAGVHYNFCAYWNYAGNAPRLTERSVVVVPTGGPAYAPIALAPSSYNRDMVVENTAPPVPNGGNTTASMDAGVTNTGTSWYEEGYDASAPGTGLPVPGSTLTSVSASDHSYVFAPSYTEANVAFVDSTHAAVVTPAIAAPFTALSFLGAAGHGPVVVDYAVNHISGAAETGSITLPDWYNNSPVAFTTAGRVDVMTGIFSSVNGTNPNLYSEDIALTNTNSPVTKINLSWDAGNTGSGVAAIFAVSGVSPLAAPFGVGVTPSAQTQYPGGKAVFTAAASGTAPFTYQWQSGNSAISGATRSTLTLSNLAANAGGSYNCVVNNNGGSVTSGNATLGILPLPVIQAAFSNGLITLTWSNNATLLQSTHVGGPWITNTAASPAQFTPVGPSMFYRLQGQ